MSDGERFLKISELMGRYGLTRDAIHRWIRQGRFPRGVWFGRAHRWPLSQLTEWESARLAEAEGGALA